jgi:hypothetical protein
MGGWDKNRSWGDWLGGRWGWIQLAQGRDWWRAVVNTVMEQFGSGATELVSSTLASQHGRRFSKNSSNHGKQKLTTIQSHILKKKKVF